MNLTASRTITVLSMVGACLVTASAAGHAAMTPPVTGCPASAELLSVTALEAQGYRVPTSVDAAGNADGIVCGKPYAPQAAEQLCPACPVPVLYGFRDNDLTR